MAAKYSIVCNLVLDVNRDVVLQDHMKPKHCREKRVQTMDLQNDPQRKHPRIAASSWIDVEIYEHISHDVLGVRGIC